MGIFFQEMRKFFVRNKGWLLVLVLLLVQIFCLHTQDRRYNYQTRLYHEQYENYLEVFGGKINEEKIARLAEEEERIGALDGWMGKLSDKLYTGEIGPEEYDRQWAQYANFYEEKAAFMQILNQYDRAKRNPESCYIMDENGWYTAVQPVGLDFSLVVAAILIPVFIFCMEYESGMYGIICCTGNGKTKTFMSKVLLLAGTVVLCGLLAAIFPLVFAGIRFGLPFGEYPIQSLDYFSHCQYSVTIGQGYLAIWGLKILALCLVGFISMLFCILLKKSISAFFASVTVTIIPYFLFDLKTLLKYIPYLGPLLSEYYFCGIEGTGAGMQEAEFSQVSPENLGILCCVGVILCILIAAVTMRLWNCKMEVTVKVLNSYKWRKGSCRIKHKIFLGMAVCFTAALFSVSCGRRQETESRREPFLYNGISTLWVSSGGGYLYDRTRYPVQMMDLADGREYDFVRDPFFRLDQEVDPVGDIFAGEEYLYYLIKDSLGSYRIIQRDYRTLAENTVYEKVFFKMQRDIFLGAAQSSQHSSYDFLNTPLLHRFCVFDGCLFLFYDEEIVKIDLEARKETVLAATGIYGESYGYYQGKLYFVSKDFSIYSYEIAADRLEKFDGVKARLLLITPEGIFYSNANDRGALFCMDFNGENQVKVTDRPIYSMDFAKESIYYVSMDMEHVYTVNFDGSNDSVLFDLSGAFSVYCLEDRGELLVLYENAEGNFSMYRYGIDSSLGKGKDADP